MMQQVATQRSEIAALPIDIDTSASTSSSNGQQQAFADVFTQTTASSSSSVKKTSSRNADDVTDAKSVADKKVKSSDTQRDTQRSANEPLEKNTKQLADDDKQVKAASQSSSTAKPDKQADGTVKADEKAALTAEAESEQTVEQPDDSGEGQGTDWLAFVDSIRRLNEGELHTGDEETAMTIDIALDAEGVSPEGEAELQAGIENLEALIAQLKGEKSSPEGTSDPDSDAKLRDIAEELNEAIAKLMANEELEQGNDDTTKGIDEEVMKIAASLLAALTKSSGKDANKIADENADLDGQAESELLADSGLLVSLIKSELNGDAGTNDGNNAQPDKQSAEETPADLTPFKPTDDLMALIADAQDSTKGVVGGALADRVVALLPDSASEGQKADVKQGVIDAVKAFQKQLETGNEPQTTLENMIADVMAEADIVPPENIEQMVSAEMRQLTLLVNAATHVAHGHGPSIYAPSTASADTTVADVQQLRAERGVQQPSDADKAVNIHQPEGQQQLAEKVRWMVNARNSMAEIRLDPPEMGSMQVRVNVSGDTASVSFIVQSPQARDALAQAEPRLREMLAEQGINLGESFVSQQQHGDTGEQGDGGKGGGSGQFTGDADEETQVVEQTLTRQAQGGIDDYA